MDEFVWRGDLDDDCTAVGNGLMLRAEQMARKHWWWAIYDKEGARGSDQLAASYDSEDGRARTGREARILAERAAWRIIASRSNTLPLQRMELPDEIVNPPEPFPFCATCCTWHAEGQHIGWPGDFP